MLSKLPATNAPGYTNNVVTTGATEYNRTNYDFKLNYVASSRLTMFARYGNSPHRIDDAYALGEAGGGSAAGGSVGLAVGRTQVLGVGATYTFSPTMMLDANFGWTHQVLGAEAPDHRRERRLRPGQDEHPRDERPGPDAGRTPQLPDQRLEQPRQRRHGQPVPVQTTTSTRRP